MELTSQLLTLASSLSLIFFLVLLWKRRYLYYHSWKVEGPLALPIIGSSWLFLGRNTTQGLLEVMMDMMKRYKEEKVVKFWMGPQPTFFIRQPEYIQVLLNRFLARHKDYRYLEMVFGDGLIACSEERWRRHRKLIALTFNQKILNSFSNIFIKHSNLLVTILEQKIALEYFDVCPILSLCTLDFICETSMGTKVNAQLENSPYAELTSRGLELASLRAYKPWLHSDFIWKRTSMAKETRYLSDNFEKYARKVVQQKRQECSAVDDDKKIFLNHLIQMTDEVGRWTDEELITETRTVIIAGCDSIAIVASYVLLMLGMHPDLQENVHQEILSILGHTDHDPTVEDLSKMFYLERFIKETMRLFPLIPILGRHVSADLELDKGLVIPEGSAFGIVILDLHRDPRFWKEPLKFDPDRFLPEEIAKRHPYTYIPFSAGPRNCVGIRYAMISLKILLSTLVKKFQITSPKHKTIEDVKMKMEVSSKCVGGFNIALKRRI